MMGSRRAVVYLLLVFLLGLAVGGLGTVWAIKKGWWHWGYGPWSSPGTVKWLTGELNLTADQQKQLEAILDETSTGYRAIRERVRPEYDQVRQAGREKIRAILTPEQRAKFEELVRRLDEERLKRRREQGKR